MASSPYIQYVTQAGDRWDTIAWAYYGIDFMAGINAIVVSSSDLPPWESL